MKLWRWETCHSFLFQRAGRYTSPENDNKDGGIFRPHNQNYVPKAYLLIRFYITIGSGYSFSDKGGFEIWKTTKN